MVPLFESIGADSPFKEPAAPGAGSLPRDPPARGGQPPGVDDVPGDDGRPGPKTPAPPPKAGLSVVALVAQSEALVREQHEPALRHCEGALRKDDRNLRAATACAIAARNLRDLTKARDFLKRLGASTEPRNAARQICLRAGLQV